jgi:outer membrane protein OmpA-like peptidoglycan-associated protein
MPEGKYSILYLPTGSGLGNYSPEAIKKEFAAENDTMIYIPFMERNKVFGKIILHRDKYSALGEIPLDNIKIYIEGNDKIYTTNTDKDGYFEAYIPVSDYYTVKVQNAFYENFSIRQEYYIVKFNGYKQFELTFEFDEKKREVKFDDKDFIVDENNNISLEDVALIRQTNLRGTVREEISQIPLHSKITIRNAENNDLISETVSSERTGIYFTTFFAGKNYTIKAETDGYWVYYDKLEINQITTFDNITRDILLRKINQDEKLRTENLTFSPEKSDLSTAAQAELDNILSLLFMNPTVKVEISGHADDVEAIKTNAQKLSDDRAKAIANYLKSHGLPPQRVEIVGRASTSPVSNDASEAGRAKNRRVELKVLKF